MNFFKAVLPVAALLISTHAEARCVVPYIRSFDNQTVQGVMYADSGKRCSIVLKNSTGPMEGMHIVSKASHGTVTASGHQLSYVSKAGYAGEDHFTFADIGRDTLNQPTTKTVEVTVTVNAAK